MFITTGELHGEVSVLGEQQCWQRLDLVHVNFWKRTTTQRGLFAGKNRGVWKLRVI